jgi:hypothetical protein
MQVFLVEDSTKSTIIYYDSKMQSGKIACLLKKAILQNKPDMSITETPYDNSLNANTILTNEITNQNNPYPYWIIIQVNSKDITKEDLAKNIIAAIDDYYN